MTPPSALPSGEPPVTITLSAESWRGWCLLASRCTEVASPEAFMEATGCMVRQLDPEIEGDTPFEKLLGMLAALRAPATQIHARDSAQVAVHGGTIVNATVEEHVVPDHLKSAFIQAILKQKKAKSTPPPWSGAYVLKRSQQRKRGK